MASDLGLKMSKKHFFKKKLTTKMKVRKFIIGALCGYIAGVVITFLWFCFLTMQLNLPLRRGTYIACVFGTIFTLCLAYNRNVRCLTLLSLPIFCSAKGRSALMAFAFMLAVSGPCMNIMKNVNVLSKSMSCGQEQLKTAIEKMLDVMKAPLIAIKNAIKIAMDELKKVMLQVEIVLKRIQIVIKHLLKSIKKAFEWLGSIVSVCNKQIGTPFDRCMKTSEKTIKDCKIRMGGMKHLCDVTKIFQGLCYSVKFLDAVCVLVDFISDTIVKTVAEKLAAFNASIREFFYVSVTFDHDFYFKMTSTKNLSQAGSEIITEFKLRQKHLFLIFGWIEVLGVFVFFIIVLKTLLYKHKFLNNNRFDNRYITKDFELIDHRRKEMGKDYILPLTRKENNRYVRLTSISLTRPECRKMARSLIFLIISCIQIFVICFIDYCVYMLLEMIRYHGRKQAGLEVPQYMTVKIVGGGFIGDIYKGLVKGFQPLADKYEIDSTECLPEPITPNYSRYYLIGGLISLAWLFVIIQPYLLRLRQVVMGCFYPERNRERSVWLHNQIMLRRTSFIKFARRAARRQFSNKNTHDKDSLLDLLRAKTKNWWIMRKILGNGELNNCVLCATSLKKTTNIRRCANPGCKGVYCNDCFVELNMACFLCKEPLDYGDDSDYSEEKDSSYELKEVKVKTSPVQANIENDIENETQNPAMSGISPNQETDSEIKILYFRNGAENVDKSSKSTIPKSDAGKTTDDNASRYTGAESDAGKTTDGNASRYTGTESDAGKTTDDNGSRYTGTESDAGKTTDDDASRYTGTESDAGKTTDDNGSRYTGAESDDVKTKPLEVEPRSSVSKKQIQNDTKDYESKTKIVETESRSSVSKIDDKENESLSLVHKTDAKELKPTSLVPKSNEGKTYEGDTKEEAISEDDKNFKKPKK